MKRLQASYLLMGKRALLRRLDPRRYLEAQQAGAEQACSGAKFGREDIGFVCFEPSGSNYVRLGESVDVAARVEMLKHGWGKQIPGFAHSATKEIEWQVQCVDQGRKSNSQRVPYRIENLTGSLIAVSREQGQLMSIIRDWFDKAFTGHAHDRRSGGILL